MKKSHFHERRKYIRAKRVLSIQHRLYKRRGKLVKDSWHLSTTENMSVNGLLFSSPVSYHKGDMIELEVVMSGILSVFKGQAKVLRAEERRLGAYYVIAVKFLASKRPARRIGNLTTYCF